MPQAGINPGRPGGARAGAFKAKLMQAAKSDDPGALKNFFAQHPRAHARFSARLSQPGGIAKLAAKIGDEEVAKKIADAVGGQNKPVPIK